MARSGSTDYSISATNLIHDALTIAGVMKPGVTMGSDQSGIALRTLNLMMKNWMGGANPLMRHLKVWQRASSTFSPGGTAYISVQIKASGGDHDLATPVDILTVNVKDDDDQETPLAPMTREDYEAIRDKSTTSAGVPTRFLYERGYDDGYLYFDRYMNSAASSYTYPFTYLRILEDIDSITLHDIDFPQEWYEPLKYNLALRLCAEFGKPVRPDVQALAKESLLLATCFARKKSSQDWYFQPEYY